MNALSQSQQALFLLLNEIGIINQLSSARLERLLPHGLTVGTMTSTLQRLEAKGFISMRANPDDGRAKIVTLTEAGRRAREAALAATGPGLADLEAVLSSADVDALIPDLQKLRIWLDMHR